MKVSYHNENEGIYVNGIATDDVIVLKVRQLKELTEIRKGRDIYGIFITGKVIGIIMEVTSKGIRYTASKPSDFKLRVIFDHNKAGLNEKQNISRTQ